MTKHAADTILPATWLEAEASEFARIWIRRICGADFFGSGHNALEPEAARWFVNRIIRLCIETHPLHAARIVEYAVHGSAFADQALRDLIAEKTNRGEPLGAVLGGYNIRLMNRDVRHHSGKQKADYLVQDVLIAFLVLTLVERFPPLRPTRSQIGWKRHPSACSIVATVLGEIGLQRGDEKAIGKIWERYGGNLADGYAWPDQGQRSLGFEG
jgi:hypothetical protein